MNMKTIFLKSQRQIKKTVRAISAHHSPPARSEFRRCRDGGAAAVPSGQGAGVGDQGAVRQGPLRHRTQHQGALRARR